MHQYPALVLNADFQPLSYTPLSLWSWEDAVHSVFRGRSVIVAEYDKTIRSPSTEMRLPSVIALKTFSPLKPRPTFTRFNVFLRDEFRCQYCGEKFFTSDLTFDHVVPRVLGGKTTWRNVVAACRPCNGEKGHAQKMKPLREPREPSAWELRELGRRFPPRFLHETWSDYLYWDVELTP